MPRITKVYTRTGDDGTTGLGTGARIDKDAARVEAYGEVDELNSSIGVVLVQGPGTVLAAALARIQNELFHLGADLCVPEEAKPDRPGPRIETRHVEGLERLIDELNDDLPPLANFILPGGTAAAAHLHLARTVCRRAERRLVALAREESVSPVTIRYLNRLSDALFVMARHHNRSAGVDDPLWDSRA